VPYKIFRNFIQFNFKTVTTLVAENLHAVQRDLELLIATRTRNYFAVLDKLIIKESVFHMKEMLPTYI
jgi:hypothetical protein